MEVDKIYEKMLKKLMYTRAGKMVKGEVER